ncbi:MAG: hypothetical protein ACREC6_01875 [Hyphomicrobiaceae bacterium]
MLTSVLPPKTDLTIGFAHIAYPAGAHFARRNAGIRHFQVWNLADLNARAGECHVLAISGLWHNELLGRAGQL